jgi:hypothetical protein
MQTDIRILELYRSYTRAGSISCRRRLRRRSAAPYATPNIQQPEQVKSGVSDYLAIVQLPRPFHDIFMTRIFPSLAAASLGLFLVAVVFGLMIGDLYSQPDEAVLNTRGVHMLLGTSAAIAVVFVFSIAVTYFVGTSRWCKEVTETYLLDSAPLVRSTKLKRKTFPLCVVGMLTMVAVAALGAASDPGTGRSNTAEMANVHLAGAFIGLAIVAFIYFRVWLNMAENQLAIQEIVDSVREIRIEKGLDVEPASAAETTDFAAAP